MFESEFTKVILLFFIGIVAGFLNVNAGGGSSLTLPVLIFLGLDSAVANGTNRIAILIQNLSAVQSFKQEKYYEVQTGLKLSLLTIPGAVAGAILAVGIADELFQKILGAIMIGIIISILIPQKKSAKAASTKITLPVYISMFGIGFYGGFIQVGVGFLLMASLKYLMKFNLVIVNMHKVFIVLIYTIPAIFIFIITDNINWFLGIVLAAGSSIGGWSGAKISVKKGEKFIKWILICAIFIMAAKLFKIF